MRKGTKDLSGNKSALEGNPQNPLPSDQGGILAALESAQRERESGGLCATLGSQMLIEGEIIGNEDLRIEGRVDGKIDLPENVLIIGAMAHIKAHVFAKAVIIFGDVTGNITATEKVEIHGSVKGDITAPRMVMSDGAHIRGCIDMQPQSATTRNAALSHQNSASRKLPHLK